MSKKKDYNKNIKLDNDVGGDFDAFFENIFGTEVQYYTIAKKYSLTPRQIADFFISKALQYQECGEVMNPLRL
jgi:hypothetical protein